MDHWKHTTETLRIYKKMVTETTLNQFYWKHKTLEQLVIH